MKKIVHSTRHVGINVKRKRGRQGARFKLKVGLQAAKGTEAVSQSVTEFEPHPSLISAWKRRLADAGTGRFKSSAGRQQWEHEAIEVEIRERVGQLKMEPERLK